ncbi:ABC transporter permease [Hoyosella sp. YIM 151337]|uniref:ABC transporter permease n=1 Tax=Hoyosella sp. YIM 151337 TaxID=2992742 RepID=UPI0022365AC8|nr:ABC transporter permease [Hoyosella sp. YIM 151337]MCW4355675.1 ABC transporter permease [Hoyosella sp. YIM 151337]
MKSSLAFIGLRDIAFARGRFTLITTVIAMMALMVVALSALTNGLAGQSVSGVERLPGAALVVQQAPDGDATTLAQSKVDEGVAAGLDTPVLSALGVTSVQLAHGDTMVAATVFGAEPDLFPAADTGALPADGDVLLPAAAAEELGAEAGDTVMIGDHSLRVRGIGQAGFFAHTPVVYTTLETWRSLNSGDDLSAIITTDVPAAAPAGTTVVPMADSVTLVPGFSAENGSLRAMQAMLLVISALVVGAFFAVWTAQRQRDLAVVRAMGGTRAYLLRDGLIQALIVLAAGQMVGAALGIALAAAASAVVPIELSFAAVVAPVAGMTILGLVGAAFAIRKVTTVDPLVALQR